MTGIGIIGAGWWAEQHALALRTTSAARLVAACRTQANALERFTQRFGGTGYTSVTQLLADPAVEAVLIASPHHLHAEHVIAAARAGKHILLEKPMAPSVAECNAILNACQRAQVRLMIGHVQQFADAHLMARDLVRGGELGEVVLGSSVMSKFWMEPNRRDWHLQPETGGGMLLTAGIHALDRLVWLMDSAVQSVTASCGARFHAQTADDAALLFLRFANGASATATSLGYAHGAPTHRSELIGTKAHLRVDPSEGLYLGRNETWTPMPNSAQRDWVLEGLRREWLEFNTAIQQQRQPSVSGEYGRYIIGIIEAARVSAVEKREVALPGFAV